MVQVLMLADKIYSWFLKRHQKHSGLKLHYKCIKSGKITMNYYKFNTTCYKNEYAITNYFVKREFLDREKRLTRK